jgi:hypothetical protein
VELLIKSLEYVNVLRYMYVMSFADRKLNIWCTGTMITV